MKFFVSLITLLLTITPIANAGPINPAHISADAKWIFHLNLEQARKWELVKQWHAKMEQQDKYKKHLKKWVTKLGMDPTKNLLGVTLYDNTYARHNGIVLLAIQNVDRKTLATQFNKNHPEATSTTYRKRHLSTWVEKRGPYGSHEVTGCLVNDGLIVMGGNPKRVREALDVIDGHRESLGEGRKVLQGFDTEAILACRAIDVDEQYQKNTRCPVLQRCHTATMSFSVKNDVMHLKYNLLAESAEVASRMKGAVTGCIAIMNLQLGDDDEAEQLVDAIEVDAQGKRLLINWQAPSETFYKVLKNQMKTWRDKHKSGWHWHNKDKHQPSQDTPGHTRSKKSRHTSKKEKKQQRDPYNDFDL